LVAVIVTPGIKAPLTSETVPPNVALIVWVNTEVVRTRHTIPNALISFFMWRILLKEATD
jgi:hypothetical protein